jgi:glycosyltransferase involved in cell wall biosynthesis
MNADKLDPLVSIFLPCFNHSKYVGKAIECALNQNYKNIEIVIGDDGSTDGSDEIILQYANKFPKTIIPIISSKNLGINNNFNNILKQCKGKYIVFTSADDLLFENKIDVQVEYMEGNTDIALCGHDVDWIDENGRHIFHEKYVSHFGSGPSEFIKLGPLFAFTSLMARLDSLPISGFDTNIKIVSDWKFQVDILWNEKKYGYIDKKLASYRRHDGNLSKSKRKIIFLDQMRVCYFVIKRSRGLYIPQCLYFIFAGSYRKTKKIIRRFKKERE